MPHRKKSEKNQGYVFLKNISIKKKFRIAPVLKKKLQLFYKNIVSKGHF